mmetsp:Transcript_6390/g.21003  ORF Transcript_6390/g.21003 Transcript_6390/m.21003 type:complete len:228 (-) Transcript_6390:329-1012(-)
MGGGCVDRVQGGTLPRDAARGHAAALAGPHGQCVAPPLRRALFGGGAGGHRGVAPRPSRAGPARWPRRGRPDRLDGAAHQHRGARAADRHLRLRRRAGGGAGRAARARRRVGLAHPVAVDGRLRAGRPGHPGRPDAVGLVRPPPRGGGAAERNGGGEPHRRLSYLGGARARRHRPPRLRLPAADVGRGCCAGPRRRRGGRPLAPPRAARRGVGAARARLLPRRRSRG